MPIFFQCDLENLENNRFPGSQNFYLFHFCLPWYFSLFIALDDLGLKYGGKTLKIPLAKFDLETLKMALKKLLDSLIIENIFANDDVRIEQ